MCPFAGLAMLYTAAYYFCEGTYAMEAQLASSAGSGPRRGRTLSPSG